MAQKLTDLVITKVALVDEGSCSAAHIKLYKRKEEGGTIMSFEEILKSLPADQAAVVQDAITKAKGELPEGAMSAEDKIKMEEDKKKLALEKQAAMGEVESLKKAKDPGTSEEDILKNANVDPALKSLIEKSLAKSKAAEAQILKMKEEQDAQVCIAKAKEVSFIPEADTKVVDLLKCVKDVAGAQDMVMDVLKSASALIEKGNAFGEFGTAGANGSGTSASSSSDQAWSLIEKAADALVVKGQVTKAKAIEMVMKQQPKLYNDYLVALRSEE